MLHKPATRGASSPEGEGLCNIYTSQGQFQHFKDVNFTYNDTQERPKPLNDNINHGLKLSHRGIALIFKKYYIWMSLHKKSRTRLHFSMYEFFNTQPSCKYSQRIEGKDGLPTLYATAKMHKDPKGFKYITVSRDTVTSVVKYPACIILVLFLGYSLDLSS